MTNAKKETLKSLVDGIVINLYHAEDALSIFDLISKNANEINKATYGQFFGSIQGYLGQSLILNLAKIYEPRTSKYQLKSIPSVIQYIRESDLCSNPVSMINIQKEFTICGVELTEGFQANKLNEILLQHFDSIIPKTKKDVRVIKLYDLRDKMIAHSEHVEEELIEKPVLAELDGLIETAKKFIRLIGFSYLDTAYSIGSSDYLLTNDAKRSAICLKRILKALNIKH